MKHLKIFAFWTFIALCFATQSYFDYLYHGTTKSWIRMITWELFGWYLWGILTIFIFVFSRRFPPQKYPVIHVPAAFVFSVIHLAIQFNLFQISDDLFLPAGEPKLELYAFGRIAWRLMVYFVILVVWYAIENRKKARIEEQKASELAVQLANAQLQALKMQLHPHFLFNTLNSISELMHQDIRAADEMMVRLGDFLRVTLDPSISQEVTLEKEVEFLKQYLEIEQVRFKDRLKIEIKISPDTRKARVPFLLLQPVVENAIRHGIGRKAEGGTVEISTQKENGVLHIMIQDDGNGLPPQFESKNSMKQGLGLSNTRSRLEKMYGEHFHFELLNRPGSGTIVSMTIPFTETIS